ncbi:MAG: DNA-binding response regulator [Bdellovibrionales bacterium RIFOXYB1_FULL_37_110]|nr:MAG: DNA-binding response regulator [Bdellovibrionales bacterium RIFOXYC1_FULL_37_79]OFZ59491.1 MAG: DNA-binding response regulator [Bdellovibrionales bacterium RIFOXYB1_FULL_37_110]OFZ64210.1 MAG: DNA-binding response regulator [Bdellovibrionales bacterium RIFOXYD1_FULL_36_51]
MKILLVEDEEKVASFIKSGFCEEGHCVEVARDGEEADLCIGVNEYNLFILDVMLPKLNGFVLCKRIREYGINTPVLMLTARDTVEDKLKGFDVGADDYLTKPFAFAELLARAKILHKRTMSATNNLSTSKYQVLDLTMDLKTRKVFRAQNEIDLSVKEFNLLQFFLENQGTVLTRTMIAEHVWEIHHDSMTNIVDVYINYLRNKIDHNFSHKLIQTVRGRGYILKG